MPRKSPGELALLPVLSKRLVPAPYLSEATKAVFLDIVGSLRPDHFHISDAVILEAFCRAVVLERSSFVDLEADPKDGKALVRWEKAGRAIAALSMRLRLSPQARRANNPSRPSRPLSAYEKMRLAEAGNGNGDTDDAD